MNQSAIFPLLKETISTLEHVFISEERKENLQGLVDYIQNKVNFDEEIRLNFICTHNSRRSHLSQVWAQTIAHHFHIKNIFCYSGGTEETALFTMVAETLENSGFQVNVIADGENPIYSIKYAANEPSIIGFSKKFDADFNPRSEFAALMTCSSAADGCPFVKGADERFSLLYDDPKIFDDTKFQAEKYREISLQIASDLFYVFSTIKL